MAGSRFFCLFNRHRPERDSVEWNGQAFVGTCKHCRTAIRRREGGGWRRRTGNETPVYNVD
ncbi:MAG: hypothetical protein NTX28_18120 [Novosphingobium sp.]|nr:hypothetical protein [Novosphingobium sp.]